ncbi:MAG TPA: ChrR family anti-sigma-E factor [Hyphomicrobiaceae bacterium]|nr:ChrR family anti-sigma-E factor [Hyphomicrobiaceae bacterium]
MSITHHPDDSTLMSYAAGSLPGALAAVTAAHLAICQRCRDELAVMELMGGALLADLPGIALRRSEPAAPSMTPGRPSGAQPPQVAEVPLPLVNLIGGDLQSVRWRWLSRGVWVRRLPIAGEGLLHLFKGKPGARLPNHGHLGSELTLVLRGTLEDSTGNYRRGDVCDLDEAVEHTPISGPEGCICVVAQDRPVRFRSLMARLARPWHGM